MNYLSICSGIEAASVAWTPLGFRPVAFAEIEAHPSAVLKYRHPTVPNLGDFTQIRPSQHDPARLLVGGTPCQDFSIAGLGAGLAGDRGNLTLEFGRLAARERTDWVLWENVAGVLSNNDGRDFAAILGLLSGQHVPVPAGGWRTAGILPGYRNAYGLAWRVLDAQFVRVDGLGRAVPQRRRRVFITGYLGDWRRPAAVLFEPQSLRWGAAPSRKTGESIANTLGGSSQSGGFRTTDLDNQGAFIPEVAWCLQERDSKGADSDTKEGHLIPVPIAFGCKDSDPGATMDVSPTLRSMAESLSHQNGGGQIAISYKGVRRLTPMECERLQGFPDDYTQVPVGNRPMADGPRYKMLGNSMAVNVMRWLGWRIQLVDQLAFQEAA